MKDETMKILDNYSREHDNYVTVIYDDDFIHIADEIIKLFTRTTTIEIKRMYIFGEYTDDYDNGVDVPVTTCCSIGPITNEKYCSDCGAKIIKEESNEVQPL